MVIQVGINGFGRIGRIVFRACLKNSNFQLSAINDPAISVEYICYLIKYDSTHGKLNGNISYTDDEIVIDDNHIKVFKEKLPVSVPWHTAGVQYVVEASGIFTSLEKASGHLASDGVKRVIVTAPSADVPMIVLGVNADKLSPENRVISCASSTLYCLAPIIKVLEDSFGVEEGFLTSIHAMTPSLKPLDGLCLRGRHWRDHRSILQNIIPATTGACKALGKILPQLKDKLSGLAFRVPIVNVSVLDLTVRLQVDTTLKEIVKSVEEASNTSLKNIIKISNDESVSSDFIGETHSCIFDENSSMQLTPKFFKIISWYENEYSYACRVLDTIGVSEKQTIENTTKGRNIRPMSLNKLNAVPPCKCFKKEMCAVCGKAKDSRIVSSTSQDTGVKVKPPSPHPLFIKKPSPATAPSSQASKDRKSNEMFKIWNDISEHSKLGVKQNRLSFFQSCVACAPQLPPKVQCNAQERLESVKKEFSKMVHITEDLLKKTNNKQFNVPYSKDKMKGDDDNKKAKEDFKGDGNSTVEESGDYRSCVDSYPSRSQNDYSALDNESYTTKDSNNFKNISESGRELNINSDIIKQNKLDRERYTNKCETRENRECTEQVAKSTLNSSFSQCIQIQYMCNENKTKTKPPVNITIPFVTREAIHESYEAKQTATDENNKYVNRKDNMAAVDLQYKSIKENNNIKVIEEELRKRNIILVDDSFDNETEVNTSTGLGKNSRDLSQQRLEELTFPPNLIATDSERTSKCSSRENTVRCKSNAETKKDIYDKLDSTSASDSNNSFEINERKSQVIQLSDLTKSLEDLGRLDKICRIIEISDELSNKLFSALDDECGTELKNKKWSFKDLCVRIKLDAFCNKVFGEPNVCDLSNI